jgi:hypothetical protein
MLPPSCIESSHALLLCVYLHEEDGEAGLPEPLAGHIFVALRTPLGTRAWGFSPVNFQSYHPHRDLERLMEGVPGCVHDDVRALKKPGLRTGLIPIDEAQARAAVAKVNEYRSREYRFSLRHRQCSTFALDVLSAAGIPMPPGQLLLHPRELYDFL